MKLITTININWCKLLNECTWYSAGVIRNMHVHIHWMYTHTQYGGNINISDSEKRITVILIITPNYLCYTCCLSL